MAYPTDLPISISSSASLDTDRQIDRASNGAARGRVFYTSAKRSFRLDHPALDATARAAFDVFYAANLATAFDFVWPVDSVTYTCIFSREPSYKPHGAGLTTITVELAEV
jgi:hypothetical protein